MEFFRSLLGRISSTPGICGGKPCVAGQRVRVSDIVVWHEHQGMSADEIVSHHPDLTLADVHAALAYYFEHIDEIQQQMREEREYAEGLQRVNASLLPSKLSRRGLEQAS